MLGAQVFENQHIRFNHINNVAVKILKRIYTELTLFVYILFNVNKSQHTHCFINTELFSWGLVGLPRSTKKVIVVHSLSFKKTALNKFFFWVQSRFVTHYIAVSHTVKKELEKIGVKHPITVLYNAVDVEHYSLKSTFSDQHSTLQIIAVIHPTQHKGAHHLIQIALRTIALFPKVHFTILGWNGNLEDKVYKKSVEDSVNSNNLNQYITFQDNVASVAEYLQSSDILIHPSESESFGIVIAEAMACGLPVVTFKVGALPEIIDNERTGYMVEPFDITQFSSRIVELAKNPTLRTTIGENARASIVERFSTQKFDQNVEQLFQ